MMAGGRPGARRGGASGRAFRIAGAVEKAEMGLNSRDSGADSASASRRGRRFRVLGGHGLAWYFGYDPGISDWAFQEVMARE